MVNICTIYSIKASEKKRKTAVRLCTFIKIVFIYFYFIFCFTFIHYHFIIFCPVLLVYMYVFMSLIFVYRVQVLFGLGFLTILLQLLTTKKNHNTEFEVFVFSQKLKKYFIKTRETKVLNFKQKYLKINLNKFLSKVFLKFKISFDIQALFI